MIDRVWISAVSRWWGWNDKGGWISGGTTIETPRKRKYFGPIVVGGYPLGCERSLHLCARRNVSVSSAADCSLRNTTRVTFVSPSFVSSSRIRYSESFRATKLNLIQDLRRSGIGRSILSSLTDTGFIRFF